MCRVASFVRGLAAASLLAVAVAGCAPVGPDFVRPKSPVLEAWISSNSPQPSSQTGLTTRSAPLTEWWRSFNDPTLTALIDKAYAQNLSLQIAGARVLQARAQLGIAFGELYPQSQSVGGGFTQRSLSENLGPLRDLRRETDIDLTFGTSQIGFDTGWELDVWGRARRGIEAGQSNLAAQIANYDDALVTLTGDVAATYINIRALQQATAAARENIALQEEGLRLTKTRFANGVTTELDVQEATTLLSNTRALLPGLESELEQSKNALAVLLGQVPNSLNATLGQSGRIPTARSNIAVGVPAELLRRRPDIRAAELEAATQSAQVGIALADLYPQFGLSGTIGLQASEGAALFASGSGTALASAGVVWNVLNYGRIQNNVRVQDAAFQELVANYQNTVLNAYAEAQNAMVAYTKAGQAVTQYSQSVSASRRAAEIAVSQYTDGAADYSRVLNTQEALLAAQVNLIEARAQRSENLVALYKQRGRSAGGRPRRGHRPDRAVTIFPPPPPSGCRPWSAPDCA